MNPMMRGVGMPTNPFGNMMNVMRQVRELQNNPKGVTDFLRNSGRLNEEQMKQIDNMNGDISQIGQFILGGAPQTSYSQIQNDVMAVNQRMR